MRHFNFFAGIATLCFFFLTDKNDVDVVEFYLRNLFFYILDSMICWPASLQHLNASVIQSIEVYRSEKRGNLRDINCKMCLQNFDCSLSVFDLKLDLIFS